MRSKALLVIIFTLLAILLTACGNGDSDKEIQNYIEEKYGFESTVLNRPTVSTGNLGTIEIPVQRKDMPDVIFNVALDGLFIVKITGDTYKEIFNLYNYNKKYQKSSLYKELKGLGFESSHLRAYNFFDDNRKPKRSAGLYLFKPGFKGEGDYYPSNEEREYIKKVKEELNKMGYELFDVTVNDIKYAKYYNEIEYLNSNAIFHDSKKYMK